MSIQKQQNNRVSTDTLGHFFPVLKRTEKLSSGTYLVTSLISDNEPIKWKLREKNLQLLSSTVSLRTKTLSEKTHLLPQTIDSIQEIISLLEISFLGGLLSEMNVEILKKEYQKLIELFNEDLLKNKASHEALVSLFDSRDEEWSDIEKVPQSSFGLFDNIKKVESKSDSPDIKDKNYKGQNNTDNVLYNKKPTTMSAGVRIDQKKNSIKDTGVYRTERKENTVGQSLNKALKKSRREKILSIVRNKKEVTIKDITSNFPGCSEKTVQRELVNLVKDNVLKKEGERRWSKYSLVGGAKK